MVASVQRCTYVTYTKVSPPNPPRVWAYSFSHNFACATSNEALFSYRYGDFTTASTSEAEGLFFLNGTVQESKLKLLSRTYAKVVTALSSSCPPFPKSYGPGC